MAEHVFADHQPLVLVAHQKAHFHQLDHLDRETKASGAGRPRVVRCGVRTYRLHGQFGQELFEGEEEELEQEDAIGRRQVGQKARKRVAHALEKVIEQRRRHCDFGLDELLEAVDRQAHNLLVGRVAASRQGRQAFREPISERKCQHERTVCASSRACCFEESHPAVS